MVGELDTPGDITPFQSLYSFGSDNPISHLDHSGLQDSVVTTKTTNLTPLTVYGHKKCMGWFLLAVVIQSGKGGMGREPEKV